MTEYKSREEKEKWLEDFVAEIEDIKLIEIIPGTDHENEYAEIIYKNGSKKRADIECLRYAIAVIEVFNLIS